MNRNGDGAIERHAEQAVAGNGAPRAPGQSPGALLTDSPEALSTKDLLAGIVGEATALVRKEVELARAELVADLRAEATTATMLGVGGVLGLCGLTLVFVTIAFALASVLPGWAASLIVTGAVLAAAGIVALVGWKRRVRSPLARTRKHLKEDVRWMKERVV